MKITLALAIPIVAALTCGLVPASRADEISEISARREDQLKAAYLFNFVKFIEWPASAPADVLTVCFVGGVGVYEALAAGIESKKAGNRPLAVHRLEPANKATGCSVLYLDAGAVSDGRNPLSGDSAAPMLTVSDAKGFAHNGGMIELFRDSNRLRFNVNIDSAEKAGLRISSSLLQLAATVEKEAGR